MAGLHKGTIYLSDQGALPTGTTPNHKTLFTQSTGVFVIDNAGNTVRLDDYDLIQSVSAALSNDISATAVSLYQGKLDLNTSAYRYTVNHSTVDTSSVHPVVSLVGPTSGAIVYPLFITNRQATSFDVVLSGVPDATGYAVDWFMAAGGAVNISGSGGGGGGSIGVSGAGVLVPIASFIEFTGTGIDSVTDQGSGKVVVTISSSGSSNLPPTVVSASGSSFTPDGLADVYDYTLTDNGDISCPSDLPNGGTMIVKFTQPPAATATISFTNANGFTWKFSNGNVPVLTATAAAIDILTVIRIGLDMYVTIIKNFQ